MEKDFIFIDENDDNKKKIFHRKLYYNFIKELITVFFEKELENNNIHLKIIELLDTLEDYDDVDFFISEASYHWAICIMYNTFETAEIENSMITPQKIKEYAKFSREFLFNNGDYLEEVQ